MRLEYLVVKPLENNVFIIIDSGEAAVIDPALGLKDILERVKEAKAKVKYIINTHGHQDHTAHNAELKEATGARLCIHKHDAKHLENKQKAPYMKQLPTPSKTDIHIVNGTTFAVGDTEIKVLHTPGHTEGSSCFYIENAGMLFTGDTLFAGTYGRTDFPGGSHADMKKSLLRLSRLPDDTKVCPGHGRFTKIGKEKSWIKDFVKV